MFLKTLCSMILFIIILPSFPTFLCGRRRNGNILTSQRIKNVHESISINSLLLIYICIHKREMYIDVCCVCTYICFLALSTGRVWQQSCLSSDEHMSPRFFLNTIFQWKEPETSWRKWPIQENKCSENDRACPHEGAPNDLL